jgi:dihydroorotase-like cyclic amidohydrolase
MSFDLLIRGATVVVPGDQPRQLDVAVADGVIAELGPELAGPAREEVDAHGLHLFPGAVDVHVHLNEPGRRHWEGFATGTRALRAGGTTSAIDMPLNAHPPTVDAASFDAKRACLERDAGVALVVEARARGVDVTCETCPHYLTLTEEDAERLGAVAKCAPPLRGPDDVAAEDLEYRHRHSPFTGRTLRARVVRTFLRGGAERGRLITPDTEDRR